MIDDYAEQKQLTRREAAMQVADWYAQHGDFSKLKESGVNTGYLEWEKMQKIIDGIENAYKNKEITYDEVQKILAQYGIQG